MSIYDHVIRYIFSIFSENRLNPEVHVHCSATNLLIIFQLIINDKNSMINLLENVAIFII